MPPKRRGMERLRGATRPRRRIAIAGKPESRNFTGGNRGNGGSVDKAVQNWIAGKPEFYGRKLRQRREPDTTQRREEAKAQEGRLHRGRDLSFTGENRGNGEERLLTADLR